MPKYGCTVCGDPNAFPFWIGEEPPAGCAYEPERQYGICRAQIDRAEAVAAWVKYRASCDRSRAAGETADAGSIEDESAVRSEAKETPHV